MPITELVVAAFKPESAKDGLAALRAGSKVFHSQAGCHFHRVGRVLRHNGKNVESEHRGILGLEWDKADSFHAFYPASEAFRTFVTSVVPYMAEKPIPKLFQPNPTYEESNECFDSGVTQVLIGGRKTENTDAVGGAWSKFLDALDVEDSEVKPWSGWGIEAAEGTWVGLVGWTSIETYASTMAKESALKALGELKGEVTLDEFVVDFSH